MFPESATYQRKELFHRTPRGLMLDLADNAGVYFSRKYSEKTRKNYIQATVCKKAQVQTDEGMKNEVMFEKDVRFASIPALQAFIEALTDLAAGKIGDAKDQPIMVRSDRAEDKL